VFRTSRLEVLVIGGALSSANLAVELRMQGIRACVVGDEAEYFALSRQAWLRPTLSVVDLALGGLVRDYELRSRSLIAAFAGIPTMLIGADANDEQLFADVVHVLPPAADADTVVCAIREWARSHP
jgi:hypothetical protein